MKFEVPFTSETPIAMAKKTMVLSDNHRSESLFRALSTISVQSGGDFEGGYFEVVDGVIRMINKDGLFCEFTGIEARNGVVFAVGASAISATKEGFRRITMHERIAISKNDFGICISSHINYEKTTLPVILSSLRKSGFDMSKVVVVVGGFKGDKIESQEGAKVIYRENNGLGFGGLSSVTGEYSYWLLLHDTCEAERSFLTNFTDIDIGLSPDVIRLRMDKDDWMGFYKTEFIDKIKEEITTNPKVAASIIQQKAKVVTVIPGKSVPTCEKDVYRTGHIRLVEKLPVGIRKFSGTAYRRKTP